MKAYFTKTPKFIQNFFKNYTWKITSNKKEIYLTFDDGPHPDITPWVLNQLNKYNAKATFFCVGENLMKYPKNYNQILEQKHSIGNHTFNHLNGWKTNNKLYFDNIWQTEEIIQEFKSQITNHKSQIIKPETQNPKPATPAGVLKTQNSKLFRPPYGKIKPGQAKKLLGMGYQIIMWDVLSADFDNNISKEQCLQNVMKHTKNGSIIVFHDSEKAFKNLEYTLPKVLEFFSENGFVFKAL